MPGGELRLRLQASVTTSPVGIATLFHSWLRSHVCGSGQVGSLYSVRAWNLSTMGCSLESLEGQQPPALCWWVAAGAMANLEGL